MARIPEKPRVHRAFGIFGGTFDPPHIGHIAALRAAQGQLGLPIVHVVVANDPWQKSAHGDITAAVHRLALCELAFGGVSAVAGELGVDGSASSRVYISDIEIVRGGPSHTIDTVLELQDRACESDPSRPSWPGNPAQGVQPPRPVLIVGEDAALGLDSWHRAAELRELVVVAVVLRSRANLAGMPDGWEALGVTLDSAAAVGGTLDSSAAAGVQRVADVSATAIRGRIGRGESVSGLLTPPVIDYIVHHGLYARQ